jgi:hypothetical protein
LPPYSSMSFVSTDKENQFIRQISIVEDHSVH